MLSKLILLTATVEAAKCPYGYTSSKPQDDSLVDVKSAPLPKYPSDILYCPQDKMDIRRSAQKTFATHKMSKADYEAIANEIIQQMNNSGNTTDYAACLLRLAGHDLMDFRKKANKNGKVHGNAGKLSGGSDGCINFEDSDNKGLPKCLAWTNIITIYQEHCDKIGLADFMVLAAEAVTGGLAVDAKDFSDGTLLSRYRDQFRFGRETVEQCPDNIGLMPNPEKSCQDLDDIFGQHIYSGPGINKWRGITAISGAHTLGSAKPENSGYDGMWGDPKNQGIFNNDYYRNIYGHGWGPKRAVGGNPDKNQWKLIDLSPTEEVNRQMMLDSDMCLLYQSNKLHAMCMASVQGEDGPWSKRGMRNEKYCKKYERLGRDSIYAREDNCCAWMTQGFIENKGIIWHEDGQGYCGMTKEHYDAQLKLNNKKSGRSLVDRFRPECCQHEDENSFGDCDSMRWPKGVAHAPLWPLAASNEHFYSEYLWAWKIATENGWQDHLTALY